MPIVCCGIKYIEFVCPSVVKMCYSLDANSKKAIPTCTLHVPAIQLVFFGHIFFMEMFYVFDLGLSIFLYNDARPSVYVI